MKRQDTHKEYANNNYWNKEPDEYYIDNNKEFDNEAEMFGWYEIKVINKNIKTKNNVKENKSTICMKGKIDNIVINKVSENNKIGNIQNNKASDGNNNMVNDAQNQTNSNENNDRITDKVIEIDHSKEYTKEELRQMEMYCVNFILNQQKKGQEKLKNQQKKMVLNSNENNMIGNTKLEASQKNKESDINHNNNELKTNNANITNHMEIDKEFSSRKITKDEAKTKANNIVKEVSCKNDKKEKRKCKEAKNEHKKIKHERHNLKSNDQHKNENQKHNTYKEDIKVNTEKQKNVKRKKALENEHKKRRLNNEYYTNTKTMNKDINKQKQVNNYNSNTEVNEICNESDSNTNMIQKLLENDVFVYKSQRDSNNVDFEKKKNSYKIRISIDSENFKGAKIRFNVCDINLMKEKMDIENGEMLLYNKLTAAQDIKSRIQNSIHEKLQIKKSKIHRNGLFTNFDLETHDLIGEYVGEIINKPESDRREKAYLKENKKDVYMFSIDPNTIVDATRIGSKLRFVNHCCKPNCYAVIKSIDKTKRVFIFASERIAKDSELTIDYQFKKEDGEERIKCFCKSDECRGYIDM